MKFVDGQDEEDVKNLLHPDAERAVVQYLGYERYLDMIGGLGLIDKGERTKIEKANESMFDAAKHGDMNGIRQALDDGADILARDGEKNTVAMRWVRDAKIEGIEKFTPNTALELDSLGCPLYAWDEDGDSLVVDLAFRDCLSVEMASALDSCGVDINHYSVGVEAARYNCLDSFITWSRFADEGVICSALSEFADRGHASAAASILLSSDREFKEKRSLATLIETLFEDEKTLRAIDETIFFERSSFDGQVRLDAKQTVNLLKICLRFLDEHDEHPERLEVFWRNGLKSFRESLDEHKDELEVGELMAELAGKIALLLEDHDSPVL